MPTIAEITARLESMVLRADHMLEAFQHDLGGSSLHTFRWNTEDVIVALLEKEQATHHLAVINHPQASEHSEDHIINVMTSDIDRLILSTTPNQSTSYIGSFIDNYANQIALRNVRKLITGNYI